MQIGPFVQNVVQPCGACQEQGSASLGCNECNFKKHKLEKLNVEINLEPGVHEGHKVVLKGEQPHKATGEEAGDLIVTVRYKLHPDFVRQGNDLIWQTRLSFESSVTGAKLVCPHFDGPLEVDTSKWGPIDPRKDYVIPGKGFKNGNLRILFDVIYPDPKIKYVLTQL
jgi:DnaJ family protein A protein 2